MRTLSLCFNVNVLKYDVSTTNCVGGDMQVPARLCRAGCVSSACLSAESVSASSSFLICRIHRLNFDTCPIFTIHRSSLSARCFPALLCRHDTVPELIYALGRTWKCADKCSIWTFCIACTKEALSQQKERIPSCNAHQRTGTVQRARVDQYGESGKENVTTARGPETARNRSSESLS